MFHTQELPRLQLDIQHTAMASKEGTKFEGTLESPKRRLTLYLILWVITSSVALTLHLLRLATITTTAPQLSSRPIYGAA